MTALAETQARTTCVAHVTCLTIFLRGLTLAIVVNNVTARRKGENNPPPRVPPHSVIRDARTG